METKQEFSGKEWRTWKELNDDRKEMMEGFLLEPQLPLDELDESFYKKLENTGRYDVSLRFPRPQFWSQEFLPNIYIGELPAVYCHYGLIGSDDEKKNRHNYSAIFDFSGKPIELNGQKPSLDKSHHSYKITDENESFNDILEVMEKDKVFEEITAKAKSGKVLICCSAGISRSAIASTLYLMHSKKLSAIEAYRLLLNKRPVISPNAGLFYSLLEYDKTNPSSVKYADCKKWVESFIPILASAQESSDTKGNYFTAKDTNNGQVALSVTSNINTFIKIADLASFFAALNIPYEMKFYKDKNGMSSCEFILSKENYAKIDLILNTKTVLGVSDSIMDWHKHANDKEWVNSYFDMLTKVQKSTKHYFKTKNYDNYVEISINGMTNNFTNITDFASFLKELNIPFKATTLKTTAITTGGRFILHVDDYAKLSLALQMGTLPKINGNAVAWDDFIADNSNNYRDILEDLSFSELHKDAVFPLPDRKSSLTAEEKESDLAKNLEFFDRIKKSNLKGKFAGERKSPAETKPPLADAIFLHAAQAAIGAAHLGKKKKLQGLVEKFSKERNVERKNEIIQDFANATSGGNLGVKLFKSGKTAAAFYTSLKAAKVDEKIIAALTQGNFAVAAAKKPNI